jgi:hypothetical protein
MEFSSKFYPPNLITKKQYVSEESGPIKNLGNQRVFLNQSFAPMNPQQDENMASINLNIKNNK